MSTNIKIGIDGMHCAACSARVEKALGALKGVKAAHVNLALEEASLEIEPGRVSREEIDKAIVALGFSVREELGKDEDQLVLEARKARKRMWHIWLVTIVVSVFMVAHMFFDTHILSSGADGWIVFLLSLYVMVFPARGVYRSAFTSLKTGSANMDVLIAMGTLASLLVWPLSFFVKDIDPHAFNGIATMILAIHHTGRYLESQARGKASEAIRKLMNLGAKTAILWEDGAEKEVPIRKVQPGDILIVKAGMKIPTDAVIIEGKANIDEAMVTGESMPVTRTAGERVLGATLNVNGYLKVKAEKVGDDTFLAQVIRLVQDAQHSKVPVQLLADKVTAVFVPIVITLAILTFAFWMLFPETAQSISIALLRIIPLKDPNNLPTGLAAALMASIATLVIACPCALGLATPTALMVGSGMGAKQGILIRNSEALQLMKDVKAIIFDKTGTLTHGKPEVIEIHLETLDEKIALGIAASLEAGSAHPLAAALAKAAQDAGAITSEVQDFTNHIGQGVSASLDGTKYILGSRKFMESTGLAVPEKSFKADYASRVYLADEDRVLAIFLIADALRDNARQVVTQLKDRGITSIMISGDNPQVAQAIAAQLGITRFHAQALPEDKALLVRQLKEEFGTVAMVGDGINDAPALKTADIGIAMGQGTDIAIEAADITIVRDDLACLPTAVELSIQTFRKIRQNLFWAFAYNLIAIPLAVFGVLHPVIAEIAMAGSSVTVVTNANLLKRKLK
jgi:Cu+-exporting ATPase